MAAISTVSQLNKIGERLRKNQATEEDLRKLDDFRVSFEPAYQRVFHELTSMGLNPGGRPQKTTQSIIAKLERERTRLSRMQDIAGCRVEVENLVDTHGLTPVALEMQNTDQTPPTLGRLSPPG